MGLIQDLLKMVFKNGISINLGGRKDNRPTSGANKKTNVQPVRKFESLADVSRKNIKEAVDKICEDGKYSYDANVDVSVFGGEYSSNYKYTYIIKDFDDELKVAVFMVPHNGHKNRHFYQLKSACENKNIPFVCFYEEMTNFPSYVEERIKAVL